MAINERSAWPTLAAPFQDTRQSDRISKWNNNDINMRVDKCHFSSEMIEISPFKTQMKED